MMVNANDGKRVSAFPISKLVSLDTALASGADTLCRSGGGAYWRIAPTLGARR